MTEIELKILLDEAQTRALRRTESFAGLQTSGPRSMTLHNIYFDTPDETLRANGIALRLRRKGTRWVQTVKRADGPIVNGLATPMEDEVAVRGQALDLSLIADDDLREDLIGMAEAGLEPVCETRFRRITRTLTSDKGSVAAFALDVGTLSSGDESVSFSEAELELIDGRPADLYDMAASILRRGPMRLAVASKSERARDLGAPAALRKHRRVLLDRGDTVEDAARAILSENFAHAHANLARTIDTDDADGPHQLRVGLRRLRSALGAFRPALGRAGVDVWGAMARDIATEAGRLRDLDVLAGELLAPLVPVEPGAARLLQDVETRRAAVREDVRATLSGAGPAAFVLGFGGYLARRGWREGMDIHLAVEPIAVYAARAVHKRWKKVRLWGDRIETLDIEARHEMRKEFKKLRYIIDSFRSLWPEEFVKPFMSRVKRLQAAFGALNDLAMAEVMLTGPGAALPDDPLAQRAVGRLIGAKSAEADMLWPAAIEEWHALVSYGTFWR